MKRFCLSTIGLFCISSLAFGESLDEWWTGTHGTGEWLGLRPEIAEHGLTFSGWWGADYIGIIGGGKGRGGTFEEELYFAGTLDVAKATNIAQLEGLSLTGTVRWRDGLNSNIYAGASPVFSPSLYQSGKGWRMMPFYATYVTPELFGIPKFLTLSGGWQNPYNFFLQQEASKLFRNNMIVSSKGITANGVGWSSSYAAWGGFLKLQPTSWYYAQAGLYLAIPGGADSANHGLDFEGARPAEENGLFFIGETGFTPSFGPSKLPGKYVFGGYSWGLEASAYTGQKYDNRWGLYWQAEQMVWREPSPEIPAPDGKQVSDGKSVAGGKSVADGKSAAPALSDEGLSLFSYFYFAPEKENALPFYFQAGATYKGLLPTRDADRLSAVLGLATYSGGFIYTDEDTGDEYAKNYEGVIEVDYRFQVNRWAYIQPFIQYLIRPGGTDSVANATAIGVHMAVQF